MKRLALATPIEPALVPLLAAFLPAQYTDHRDRIDGLSFGQAGLLAHIQER